MAVSTPCDPPSLVRYQNAQLKRFRANLSQALVTEDPDAVHDLRVASRRLHDALEVMGTWVGQKRAARAQRALKRVRKAFRDVRDLDVLRLSLGEEFGPENIDIESAAQVESILMQRRRRAAIKAQRAGRKTKNTDEIPNIKDMNETFLHLAEREPTRLETQLKQVLRLRAQALVNNDPRKDTTDLHQTRIHVKKTRYCAQLINKCRCLDRPELIDMLTRIQNTLGHWNDQIVAVRTLSRLANRRKRVSRQTSFSANVLQ
jgi:CHAD domain-containing protein